MVAPLKDDSYTPLKPFASTVAHLLEKSVRSSSLLNEDEKSQVRGVLQAANDHLGRYDQSIIWLDAEMRRLITEREALVQSRDLHALALAPIYKCPPELLSEIFLWSIPVDKFDGTRWAAIIFLSHVCRFWREAVVNNMASLWSSLILKFNDEMPFNGGYADLEWLQEWIRRSRGGPLSVTISDSDVQHRPGPRLQDHIIAQAKATFEKCLDLMMSTTSFWRSASLDIRCLRLCPQTTCNRCCVLHTLVNKSPLDFSSLEHLKISFFREELWGSLDTDPELDAVTVFEHANLRSLSMRLDAPRRLGLVLPFAQLQRLELTFGNWEESDSDYYLSLIPQMPSLSTLILDELLYHITDEQAGHPLTQHAVRNLFIRHCNKDHYISLFNRLSLPNLKKLWIDGSKYFLRWNTYIQNSLLSLINTSSIRLQTLSLGHVHNMSTGTLLEILRLMPCLTEFHFCPAQSRERWLDSELFSQLTLHNDTSDTSPFSGLCPNLQHLKFNHEVFYSGLSALLDMVQSRLHPRNDRLPATSALLKLEFELRWSNVEEITWFRALENVEGSQLSVSIKTDEKFFYGFTDMIPPGSWDNPIEDDY